MRLRVPEQQTLLISKKRMAGGKLSVWHYYIRITRRWRNVFVVIKVNVIMLDLLLIFHGKYFAEQQCHCVDIYECSRLHKIPVTKHYIIFLCMLNSQQYISTTCTHLPYSVDEKWIQKVVMMMMTESQEHECWLTIANYWFLGILLPMN